MNSDIKNLVNNYKKDLEVLENKSLLVSNKRFFNLFCIILTQKKSNKNKFKIQFFLFLLLTNYNLQLQNNDLDTKLIAVLLARDAIFEMLKTTDIESSECLIEISKLDARLKLQFNYINTGQYLSLIRDIRQPSIEAWWWFADNYSFWKKYDWIWKSLNLPFSAINISLAIDISSRFFGALTEQPNIFGIIAFSTPNVLAVMATGGTLTQAGKNIINDFLLGLKIPKIFWEELKLSLTFIVLIILFTCKLSLPLFAVYFNNEAVNELQKGNLESVITNYEIAIKLKPGYPEANYGLGIVYEIMQDKKASSKYYRISAFSGMSLAYIKLGRLYILDKKYAEAAIFLEKGKKLLEKDIKNLYPHIDKSDTSKKKYDVLQFAKYHVLRNLGWVRLELGQVDKAKNHLLNAISFAPEYPTAYCIMALVLEKEGNKNRAFKEWSKCYKKYLYVREYELYDISTELEYWAAIANKKINLKLKESKQNLNAN